MFNWKQVLALSPINLSFVSFVSAAQQSINTSPALRRQKIIYC